MPHHEKRKRRGYHTPDAFNENQSEKDFGMKIITRRRLMQGATAAAATVPMAAAAFQGPVTQPADLPDWWKDLVSDLKQTAVPHINGDGKWSVVRNDKMDALCEAAGLQEPKPKPIKHDPHYQWLDEWKVLRMKFMRAEDMSAEANDLWDRACEIEEKIYTTPATTMAGACHQIEWVLLEIGNDDWFSDGHRKAIKMALSALRGGSV